MIQSKQVYKCSICGNIVEVLHAGGGTLVCCGKPMELLPEKTSDAGLEKHVPVIEKSDSYFLVKVGSVNHPMEENHHIQWVELVTPNYVYKKSLNSGEKPEAIFTPSEEPLYARAYCNIHGLWKSV